MPNRNLMDYKILGKTRLKVSELAFGALQFARLKEHDAIKLARYAYDSGINLYDTAYSYPNSENLLGKSFKGIREYIYIITKSVKKDKKGFLEELGTSLKRLKTDYIDIYLFHCVSKVIEFEAIKSSGVIDALINEKRKGKVRHIGFSCHNPSVIDRFYEVDDFSVLMIPLNFMTTEYIKRPLLEKFKENNIGLLAMKPFGGGRLIDIELCFKFLKKYPQVIPVAGMQTIEELRQNLEYVKNNEALAEADYKRIREISQELGTKFCRGCGYCMPCDNGIEIVDINFIKIYYKQFSSDDFLNLGLSEKVELARECTECGKCSQKCPFELNVPEIIKENITFFDSLKNR